MYSGFALSNRSGNWLGVHQKLDRVAYNSFLSLEQSAFFPELGQILHFEGKNGPDGLKIKSPGRDEPYHFYNPAQPEETDLLTHLENHQLRLIKALQERDIERSAFEAAWLAHVIVDGLTPAHHYPYQEESHRLRGEAVGCQKKVLGKIFIKKEADGWWSLIEKNWQLWGSRGLIISHALFELGVALIVKPANLSQVSPGSREMRRFQTVGLPLYFQEMARRVADYEIYRSFQTWGWTPRLALQVRYFLVPQIVNLITLAWLDAARSAAEPLVDGSISSSRQLTAQGLRL